MNKVFNKAQNFWEKKTKKKFNSIILVSRCGALRRSFALTRLILFISSLCSHNKSSRVSASFPDCCQVLRGAQVHNGLCDCVSEECFFNLFAARRVSTLDHLICRAGRVVQFSTGVPRTAANAASSLAVGASRMVHPSWEGLATAPKSCARSEQILQSAARMA